jgi:DNA-binding NarL/FixJ family response regulator
MGIRKDPVNMHRTTVVMADDHPVVRMGVGEILRDDPSLSLLLLAASGAEAIVQTQRLMPDVLITDLAMPGISGFDVIRRTREHAPETRIIAFSSHDNPAYVLEAMNCGASGYVLKDADPAQLLTAVHTVNAGKRFLNAELAAKMIDSCTQGSETRQSDGLINLTAREREVFLLAAAGRSNVQIGETLFISTRTAETHRWRMMRKLNLKTSLELALFAVRRGYLVS